MDRFFEELKKKRAEKNITQQEIADRLDISIKQYQNYEYKTIPPHEKLLKLNEIFDYDFSKIIYQEKVPREIDQANEEQPDYLTKRRNLKNGTVELLKQLPYDPIINTDIDIAASEPDIELYDDNNKSPEDYYYIPEFSGCRAFNVYSDSMEPKIPKGCKIFAKKVEDWQEVLELGQIYAIGLHDGRRFIKVIKKSKEKGKDYFLLHSENSEYDDWDLPKEKIRSIWLIDGWMNKATQSTYFVLSLDKNNKRKK